jgi:formiminoglutamase
VADNYKDSMKDIALYFTPVESEMEMNEEVNLATSIQIHQEHFPELTKGMVAIFYVPEYRGAADFAGKTNDRFRNFFYQLFAGSNWTVPVADLGTIKPGNSLEDTYYAVANVVTELVKAEIIPIIIGGSQDLTLAQYKGYEQLEQVVNLATIDSTFDIGSPEQRATSNGFLSHIILHEPCYLFNYSNIGYQSYLVNPSELELMETMYFDTCRLGAFNQDFKVAEPLLRNCDMVSLDCLSIRSSDFASAVNTSPNGFYAEQVCQIARYAGMSDKMTSFGVYNIPDAANQSDLHLIAQIIWHVLDGINNRKFDFPVGSKAGYAKYNVTIQDFKDEIVFYKSDRSDRWWMEVPYPPKHGSRFQRHHMVPCNYEDYLIAGKNEIPDLWWKTYQKLV